MPSLFVRLPLLTALCPLASTTVIPVKDESALGTFLKKHSVALVEFFDEKAGGEVPEDLKEAAKQLEAGDNVAVARVPGTKAVGEKFEVTAFPTIKFFAAGKPHGDAYDGDRGEDGASQAIIEYAREAVQEAQDQGVVKEAVEIEELKSSRADRLCFKAEGLCAIYLANGRASKDEIKMLAKLKRKNTSKLAHGVNARGTTFNWSWLDATAEPAFMALLKGEPAELPGMIIYNPHKRPRHAALEEGTAATEDSVQNLLDKILGGDARFTTAKGQKLPTFAGKGEL